MKKLNILFLISLWIAGLLHTPAGAFSLALNADQVIENNGGYWVNPEYSYQEDTLYASVLGSANGARYLRLGLENPVLDTTNIKITGVTIYVKAYSSYSKTKARIQPYFNDIAGLESGNLNIGTSEVLRSYDITNQRSWTWQDLNELSIRFTPKTAAYFYINYIFAVVNYTDSTVLGDYTFQFSAISSPETLGYYFPVTIIALDSLGDTATSYNGNASLSDSTGTITPINAQFVSGVCNTFIMIGENTSLTAITVNDGDTFAVSNGFSVVSGLHHFWIAPIVSPQNVNQSFAVSISACDFNGDTLTSFNEKADLWDLSGTLTPDSSGVFSGGLWAGNLTISAAISSDTLYCSRTIGGRTYSGKSNGFAVPTGISGEKPVILPIKSFGLDISPNPTSGRTQILLAMPKPGRVVLILYNILGQEVARKEPGLLPSGNNKLNWVFESTQPQGLYFLRAMVDNQAAAMKKLLMMR
jgi:hypothetical protein